MYFWYMGIVSNSFACIHLSESNYSTNDLQVIHLYIHVIAASTNSEGYFQNGDPIFCDSVNSMRVGRTQWHNEQYPI